MNAPPPDDMQTPLPTVADSEARIRRDVAKIRARSGAANVARQEADRIEGLRQAANEKGKS